MVKQYFYNHLVALSQYISVVLGGDVDESICQRLAKAKLNGSKSKTIEFFICVINPIMYVLLGERNHVENSIVGEKNTKEIWKWG